MTYIIAEPCIGTKDTACVDVCPVDCIHPRKDEDTFEGAEMLFIHPDECIDCGACEPACPVQAIFSADDLPAPLTSWKQVNADKTLTPAANLKHITETQEPLPTAEAKKASLGL